MFRAVLLFLVGLLVGACTQAAVVPSTESVSVQTLESATVALARVRDDGRTKAFCSGVWVSETTILTAAHCLEGFELVGYLVKEDVFEPGVLVENEKPILRPAKPYSIDEAHDLALLRASLPPQHGIARVRVDSATPGARVSTMGHPLGLWWSFSSGEVAAVRAMNLEPTLIYIQTTAPTSPGNSGCGLFDGQGFLVGLAHAGMPKGANLAFYVHAYYVDVLLKAQGANL